MTPIIIKMGGDPFKNEGMIEYLCSRNAFRAAIQRQHDYNRAWASERHERETEQANVRTGPVLDLD